MVAANFCLAIDIYILSTFGIYSDKLSIGYFDGVINEQNYIDNCSNVGLHIDLCSGN